MVPAPTVHSHPGHTCTTPPFSEMYTLPLGAKRRERMRERKWKEEGGGKKKEKGRDGDKNAQGGGVGACAGDKKKGGGNAHVIPGDTSGEEEAIDVHTLRC